MLEKIIGKITFWKVVLFGLFALGAYATFVRFFIGLGAATNLSDNFAWGLWIGFDVVLGVGLAAGGFVIAATVHVFGIEKYKPIARPAILTAFLGYLLVIVGLMFDLGQPWRIWHALIMWNPHSVMFEVAWCVMLYTTVLAVEFSPMLFERLGWQLPLRMVRTIYIPLVITGVLLSTMHQSSLGTLYVIVPDKLYGLWYSPLLPVFFFISAIAAGLAMTIIESYLSCRTFGKSLEDDLLRGLARVIVVTLAVLTVLRLNDLLMMGNFHLMFEVTRESVMFWGEVALGMFLPMVLLSIRKVRHNRHGLFLGAVLTVLGFVMNRLNVTITGMQRGSGADYFPSWMELAVTASIVAAGFVLFALAVKFLKVFAGEEIKPCAERPLPREPLYGGRVIISLWVLLLIVAVLLVVNSGGEQPEAVAAVSEGTAGRMPEIAYNRGDDLMGQVSFRHASHITKNACTDCHTSLFAVTAGGAQPTVSSTDDGIHGAGNNCYLCHGGEASARAGAEGVFTIAACEKCHTGASEGWRAEVYPGRRVLESDEGPVAFLHESHVGDFGYKCSDCHLDLFAFTPDGKPHRLEPAGDGVHESNACGKCHSGGEAFSTGSENNCERCHGR